MAIAPQRISTGMPQLLEFGAGKSSWDSTRKPHKDCPSLTERSHGTQSSTTTPKRDQDSWVLACFLVPINVTAASPS